MRVHLTNLGCKLNQAELESLARELTAAGHETVADLAEADLHLVNTCTVTHRAARDSRKLARRGRRVDPRIRTVLTGCYASEKPEEAAALEGVDLVVTNEHKEHLLSLLHERFPEPASGPDAGRNGVGGETRPVPGVPRGWEGGFGNTRASVKVEDGCNMRCAFCIIPFTRGRQRSRPLPEVVAEVDALARAGAREVVITGVQISHYRWQGRGLYELVTAVLEETASLGPAAPRLRVTSIAPWKFDDRLLELFTVDRAGGSSRHRSGHRRLCRHVHLSLQSGSTATLRRMRRPYTAAQFAELVARLRAAVPGLAVTTDVIVGFPGETDREFEDSLAFVREMGFAKVHVFPYSVREGTEAASLPDAVPHELRRRRMGRMLELAEELERDFQRQQIGQRLEVLWEERRNGVWLGTTDNYVRVQIPHEELEREPRTPAPPDLEKQILHNRRTEVEIIGLAERGVTGRLLEPLRPPSPSPPPAPAPEPFRPLLPVVG